MAYLGEKSQLVYWDHLKQAKLGARQWPKAHGDPITKTHHEKFALFIWSKASPEKKVIFGMGRRLYFIELLPMYNLVFVTTCAMSPPDLCAHL